MTSYGFDFTVETGIMLSAWDLILTAQLRILGYAQGMLEGGVY